MNKKKETLPKWRFSEFQGCSEWKSEKIGRLGEVITGKTPLTSDLSLWNGDIQFVTPTDITDDKYQYQTQRNVAKIPKMTVLPKNTIMFTCIASIGKMSLSVQPCITNQQINSVITKPCYNSEFIYYSLLRKAFLIKSQFANVTLPIINKTDFSNIYIPITLNGNEQQKIADCLSSIDELIEAESRKLIALEKYKKGLMQKLFPAEGKTLPEWRFPEFQGCGKWQESTIAEVTSYVDYRGKTPVKAKDGIFLVTAKNIKMGYIDYNASKEYIPKDQYLTVMSRGIPQLGDVLITTEAPCGNVAQIDKVDVALAQRVIKYRGDKNKINNTFLKYVFLSPPFQSELKKNSTGGIVGGIKGSVLHQMSIKFPYDIIEQQKIADCLSDVDTMISEQSNKVEQLKTHKKGLMQGLFPSLEEADV